MSTMPAAPQFRSLAVLSVAVVAGHVLLLNWAPSVERPSPLAQTFSTRTLRFEGSAPAATVGEAPQVAATQAARPPAPWAATGENANRAEPPPVARAEDLAPAPAGPPEVQAAPVPAPAPAEPAPAAAGPSMAALSIPGSVRLRYNVNGESKGMSYTANAELAWLHDGNRYDARLEVGAAIGRSRIQTSSGRLTPMGLAPTRFSDKSRSEVAAHFDAEQGRVTFSGNKDPAALEAGAQDRLSVFLQLTALLAGDPQKYPPGTEIPIQTIGPNLAEPWIFRVEGMETIRLPTRDIAALKLSRTPRHPYDTRADLWFAPSMDYLPARIRLTLANGDSLEQVLRSADKP